MHTAIAAISSAEISTMNWRQQLPHCVQSVRAAISLARIWKGSIGT